MTLVAAVSLIERDNKLLCVWNKRYGGWSLPGGKMETGETPEQAQERELFEETGMNTLARELIFVGPHNIKVESTRGSTVYLYRVTSNAKPFAKETAITWLLPEQFLKESPFASFYQHAFALIYPKRGEVIDALIDRSSLGTPEAKALRASAPKEVVDLVLARADELSAERRGIGERLHDLLEVEGLCSCGDYDSTINKAERVECIAAIANALTAEARAPLEARIKDLQDTIVVAIDLLADDAGVRGLLESALGKEVSEEAKRAGEIAQRNGDAQRVRLKQLEIAIRKINDIRNSIVSLQTINWSEHIYPLVAALDEAGVEGKPYPADREYLGSLIEQRDRWREAALRRWPKCVATTVYEFGTAVEWCEKLATKTTPKEDMPLCDACFAESVEWAQKQVVDIEDADLIREHVAGDKQCR